MSSSIVIFFSYPTSSKFVNTLGLSKKYVESDHFTSSPLPKLLNEFPDSFPEALKSILEIKNSIKKKSFHIILLLQTFQMQDIFHMQEYTQRLKYTCKSQTQDAMGSAPPPTVSSLIVFTTSLLVQSIPATLTSFLFLQ